MSERADDLVSATGGRSVGARAAERSASRCVYGGPSPEHDVSILTGLQAVHALSGATGIAAVRSLYWSKTGDWYEVRAGAEAADFVEGVPANAARLRLISGPGGGFVRPGERVAAKERPPRARRRVDLLPRRAG